MYQNLFSCNTKCFYTGAMNLLQNKSVQDHTMLSILLLQISIINPSKPTLMYGFVFNKQKDSLKAYSDTSSLTARLLQTKFKVLVIVF